MKQNKWGLLFSAICTVISLIGYLCSTLTCFIGNSIIADISVAIFSSSVFVVILSTIGYLVERKRQRSLIIQTSFVNWLDLDPTFEEGKLCLHEKELKSLLNNLLNKIIALKNSLQDYYKGLILKDKLLKTLINENLYDFYKSINEFIVYIAYPNCNNDVVNIKFNEIRTNQEDLLENLIEWMKKRGFELGKEFDFGENFITNYENSTLKLTKE